MKTLALLFLTQLSTPPTLYADDFSHQFRRPDSCELYWDARKNGTDWRMQPPLSQYDSRCASNIVVAKDWRNQCAVFAGGERSSIIRVDPATTGREPIFRYRNNMSLSWFDCNVHGTNYSFGDYVPGQIAVDCTKTCLRCNEYDCSIRFEPRAF